MSTTINVDNVVTLRLGYRDDLGNRAFNILHYRLDNVSISGGGLFPGELAAVVLPAFITAARLTLPNAWKAAASVGVSMVDMTAQSIKPAPKSRAYTSTFLDPVPGAVLGDMLPLQDAPTLLKRTNLGGRGGLGRLFFVGVPESNQQGGLLLSDFMDAANDFGLALAAPIVHTIGGVTYTWGPVLYGKTLGPVVVEIVTGITDVTISDDVIKTQRRRRPGKGI